jgi:beta-glucanase (GH16 family)
MKHLINVSLFLIIVWSICSCSREKLVWSDEFDYTGLPDSTKWSYEEGFVRNHELQYYTTDRAENVRVENGTLILETRKEQYKNENYETETASDWRKQREFADFTSVSLTTKDKQAWRYGRIEVRAKLPTGIGMWPAIWLLGKNMNIAGWPECGEIDIMENVGFDPEIIHGNIHTQKYNHIKKTNKGSKITVEKPYQLFHTYAIEWSEEKIDFFVENTKYFSFENENSGNEVWPFDKEHYLILNIAIGGSWGGQQGVDDSIFPQQFVIDFVRVYKK